MLIMGGSARRFEITLPGRYWLGLDAGIAFRINHLVDKTANRRIEGGSDSVSLLAMRRGPWQAE
jgi:hypothetical protein